MNYVIGNAVLFVYMLRQIFLFYTSVSYKDLSTGEIGYLNPDAIAEGSGNRWSSHPDMVKQFAKCVQKKFAEFNVTSMKLYFDVWRSMTKRFQQVRL